MVSKRVTAFAGVDHIDCVSHDLARTQAQYRQLGFTVVGPIPGGDAPETSTCWVVARNVYLSTSTFRHFDRLHPIMQHYMAAPGVGATLWRVHDPLLADRELREAGFETYPLVGGEREVTVNGQSRRYRFTVLPFVPPARVSTGDFLNLGIQHFTREIPEDPAHLQHENGLIEFRCLTAVVPDLDAVVAGLTRLLGSDALRIEPGCLTADAVALQRRFVHAERYDSLYGAHAGPGRPKVVTMSVRDLGDIRRRCRTHSIEHSERPGGGILVSSAYIEGTALEFVAP